MNEKLLNPATLRHGTRLERLAWLLMQVLGVPLPVATARVPVAPRARPRAR